MSRKTAIDTSTGASSLTKKAEGSIISKRHPAYSSWIARWEFFLDSYFGGDEYCKKNLFKYFKEGDEEFIARTIRSYRENHSRRIIDLITSYLFKETPVRVSNGTQISKFIANADGKGGTLDHFMKGVSQLSSAMGRIYVVIDKEPVPEAQKTGTLKDNFLTVPYCYPIYPQDVLDVSFDKFGKVKWALIRENNREGDDSINTAASVIKNQYRLWEKGRWSLYNDSGARIGGGATDLDCCPVIAIDNEEIVNSVYSGHSLIADIAYLDRAIFNNWSRLDTIVCDQTFSQLIFPVEGLLAEVAEDEELRNQFMTLATNRILLYSSQAAAAPSYISPDAAQAQFILDMIQVQVKQLYSSIGLQAEGNTENVKASGVAKAYDFDKLNRLLANKADNLETAEKRILDIVKEWSGQTSSSVEVRYPTEFDTRSLVDDLAIAERLILLDISDTLMKELNKNLAAKALPKTDDKMIAAINKEIDDRVDEKRKMAEKMESIAIDTAELGAVPADDPTKLQKFGGKDDGAKPKPVAGDLDSKVTNPRQQHMPLASKKQSQAKAANNK